MTKSLRYSGGLRLLVDRRGSSSAGKFSSSSDSCLSSSGTTGVCASGIGCTDCASSGVAGYSSCVGMLDRGSGVGSYVGVFVESSYWYAVGGSRVWAATL